MNNINIKSELALARSSFFTKSFLSKQHLAQSNNLLRLVKTGKTKTPARIMTTMFEAKLADGTVLKRIVDAIKDLVQDVNLDISASGISL